MKTKKMSIILFIAAFINLAIGAAFHAFRVHPENTLKFRIGVTMGALLLFLTAIYIVVGILLLIVSKHHTEDKEA